MNKFIRHIPALFTALVWGSTFAVSKGIIEAGVSRYSLMTIRFVLAYISLCLICPKPATFGLNMRELKLLLVGITGGSLYFYFEYTALTLTTSVNTGLISSTVPVISTLIYVAMGRKKLSRLFMIGSLTAFFGVALVVFNGNFSLDIHPLGDFVSIISAVMWAVYTVLLASLGDDISELQATRRLFFYAVVTIIPFSCTLLPQDVETILSLGVPAICGTLYLGLLASGACLWLWHKSISLISLTSTNNYLYLLPIVSVITGYLFFTGEVTIWTIIGAGLIVSGIVLADKN